MFFSCAQAQKNRKKKNNMLIIVTEPCCKRVPFEPHKKDCRVKREERELDRIIYGLIKQFKCTLKGE